MALRIENTTDENTSRENTRDAAAGLSDSGVAAEVRTSDPPAAPHVSARWDTEHLRLAAYLERIGYDGSLEPTLDTLTALMHAHLVSIPFEGMNAYLGLPIPLDIESLQDKLVRHRRGGYCYEQNILFGTVLTSLGFEVTLRNARILMGADENVVTGRGHAALSVMVDGIDHHVDVGVGNVGPRGPVPLAEGVPTSTGDWDYRFDRSDLGMWVLRYRRPAQGDWFAVLQFDESIHYRPDFEDHNLAAAHPGSAFAQQLIVSFNGADERHALTGTTLKTYSPDGHTRVREFEADAIHDVLWSVFGIEVAAQVQDLLVERLRETAGAVPEDVRDL